MHKSSHISAYIAIGSNMGDRRKNFATAIEKLKKSEGIEVVRVSSFLDNPAIGMGDNAPRFLNAAIAIQTTLSAAALLARLLEIETEMGREDRDKWEPRIIDLDLLLYGNEILAKDDLMVPHPLMHERRFVLEPLSEIAPDVVHPTLQMTMAGLLENMNCARAQIPEA